MDTLASIYHRFSFLLFKTVKFSVRELYEFVFLPLLLASAANWELKLAIDFVVFEIRSKV